ncbi:MAG: hypothetical protein AAB600_03045 [Patescibacteria group bacterium]
MSIPSFGEIKSIMEILKGDNEEGTLIKVSYIIFGVILYVALAILFTRHELYLLTPFNLLLETGIIPVEIAKNISIVLVLLYIYFAYLLLYLIWKSKHNFPFLRNGYKWNLNKGLSDWDFQGNIIVDQEEKTIHIVQSELGCIVRNRNWKNFTLTFEFKIPDPPLLSPQDTEGNKQLRRGFGIIYRAKQLGEYYMIKIDENGCLPHVRNLYWENNGPIWKPKIDKSDLNKWISITLVMIENTLTIEIKSAKFSFMLPTHSNVHHDTNYPYGDGSESRPFVPILFRNSGSVGFRSAPFEEVFIRNFRIEEESLSQFCKRKLEAMRKFLNNNNP